MSDRYDGRAVADAIERDVLAHGAPLAWRMGRAKAHRVSEVDEVPRAHGVIVLHGPPLNAAWRRRTLGWRTSQDVWKERPMIHEDRLALREEVTERTARIARDLDVRGRTADLAERLAIEAALTQRGYLRIRKAGWC